MLCITRRANERVFIGPDIVITIRGTDRGKVFLGITAPKGVRIFREEVLPDGFVPAPEPAPEPVAPEGR